MSEATATPVDTADRFVRQYVATMLWSTHDDEDNTGPEPCEYLDFAFDSDNLAPETLARCIDDCKRFAELAGDMLNEHSDPTMWPHDFWLTRNGHGAGFWDGDWPKYGKKLTEICKLFPELTPYVGDDGFIYFG